MAKPRDIELADGTIIPILFEDRSVIAIDKPAGWILAPDSWNKTGRNLQLAIHSSIGAGDFWARSRSLRFLRFVHRLDADTSGVLMMARSPGALHSMSDLFRARSIEKRYLAVVSGVPKKKEWSCELKLGEDPRQIGLHRVDSKNGKEAETLFKVVAQKTDCALVEACPITGRTHQIRLHLQACGHPILGDPLYGPDTPAPHGNGLGLRAISLGYKDPFNRKMITIRAPASEFRRTWGFTKQDTTS